MPDLDTDPAGYHVYKIECASEGNIHFYVDKELKATHTADAPSGALCWKMSIKNTANANNFLRGKGFVYASL